MYNHNLIEKKWQDYWRKHNTYYFSENPKQKKYYVLNMFPYPSGAGLHCGHTLGYTQSDVMARYKHFNNFNVLQPMGWDAFGLPAEHFALKNKKHPSVFNQKNINTFRTQLQQMGYAYDYRKEVDTTDPKFYEWTQWIFIKLYEKGFAEIKEVEINWCEDLGTALANEEVIEVGGKMVSECGKFSVVKKIMKQWVLKISAYADKLIDGLNDIEWEDYVKQMQINWIGKNTGASIDFSIHNTKQKITVFTTRPDTIYGVSYLVLAPEHPLVLKLVSLKHEKEVLKYIKTAQTKSDLQRKDLQKDKTGVFIGNYAINPVTKQEIPIYIADYVLLSYGTGAVMGVPAHDERDWDFAKKYKLPIKYVIKCSKHNVAYCDDGEHIESPLINGLHNKDAINKIIKHLTNIKVGKAHTTYKIHDWVFSRQRYWGEPFPVYFDENNKVYIDKNLPVLLPRTNNITPTGTIEGPLANIKKWVNFKIGNKSFRRETNTMPQWAGSSWYFLAYILKKPNGDYYSLNSPIGKKLLNKWMPVDYYNGGMEHAVLHLLYARFWHRFLYDIGVVNIKEPFHKLINHGTILGSDNQKMSKSTGNVVNPTDYVNSHGADALRLYLSFIGPIGGIYPWDHNGINGSRKWLERVYRLFNTKEILIKDIKDHEINPTFKQAFTSFLTKVSENINNIKLNIAVSEMMVFVNECYKYKILAKKNMIEFLIVLSCFAPHLAEELYAQITKLRTSIYSLSWPVSLWKKDIVATYNLPIQINGKLRGIIIADKTTSKDNLLKTLANYPKINEYLVNKKIVKIIFVSKKIANIIVK